MRESGEGQVVGVAESRRQRTVSDDEDGTLVKVMEAVVCVVESGGRFPRVTVVGRGARGFTGEGVVRVKPKELMAATSLPWKVR